MKLLHRIVDHALFTEVALIETFETPLRPFRNRVWPTSEIRSTPARGLFMGNRGRIHGADQRLLGARWTRRAWITCSLAGPGNGRNVMGEGYTALFFLDEAVALAAGHRPCAQCRRRDYDRFLDCWFEAFGERPRAAALDQKLHSDRLGCRGADQKRYTADIGELPDGTFVFISGEGRSALLLADRLLPFSPDGYGSPLGRPRSAKVEVLTPRCTIGILKAGYRPQVHPSALQRGAE